jgi:hypothetical protein
MTCYLCMSGVTYWYNMNIFLLGFAAIVIMVPILIFKCFKLSVRGSKLFNRHVLRIFSDHALHYRSVLALGYMGFTRKLHFQLLVKC